MTYGHFSALLSGRYDERDIKLLWHLISYCDCLPMGAPSSPAVSNRVMYQADTEIAEYLKKVSKAGAGFWAKLFGNHNKLIYSRYSDDITVSSGERIGKEHLEEISKILNSYGFLINKEKTRFCGPGERKRITGVTVENGRLTLGNKFKRDLKKKVYNRLTKKEGSVERIRGLISYAASIEPAFARSLRAKYAGSGFYEEFYPRAARR